MRSDAGAKTKPFGPGVDGAASTMSLCVEEVVLLTLPLNFSISLVVKGVFFEHWFQTNTLVTHGRTPAQQIKNIYSAKVD